MHIVTIHGHRATPDSFNFLRLHLPDLPLRQIDYDSSAGFYANHLAMLDALEDLDDLFFIAHSLGGLHAVHLADKLGERVAGAVTISTPYGGSEVAAVLGVVMPFHQVLHDIRPAAWPVRTGRTVALPPNWTNIVSTDGSPLMLAPNDGVVSVESMRSRQDIRLVDIDRNHYEVLLSMRTVEVVRDAIAEALAGQADARRSASA